MVIIKALQVPTILLGGLGLLLLANCAPAAAQPSFSGIGKAKDGDF
ncbi:MAG: hypothetical protein H0W39_01830 [Sphingomonas sp.]|nr:hypothetical protein [Sphingomonas sp.]